MNFGALKDIVFRLIFLYQKVVFVTGKSFKMALTLSQKWLTIFGQKAQNFEYFVSYDFVQISPACGPNTYQIVYGETLDFQCQRQ